MSGHTSPTAALASPRSFHLPLRSEQDQSAALAAGGGSHAHATISATAAPAKSARRAGNQARIHHQQRRSPMPLTTGHAAEEAVAAAAESVASPVPARAVETDSTISALLVAATTPSQSPISSPLKRAFRRRSSGLSINSHTAADLEVEATVGNLAPEDDAMLFELSSAMHAQERASHAFSFPEHGVSETTATATVVPSATLAALTVAQQQQLQRRMPTLPAAQLKSLVRSHVRHVGLSARLKTRTHVRSLREAQAEARQRAQVQAVKAVYLSPMPTRAAAAAAEHAGSQSTRTKRPRGARGQQLASLETLGLTDTTTAATSAAILNSTEVVPWPSWLSDPNATAVNPAAPYSGLHDSTPVSHGVHSFYPTPEPMLTATAAGVAGGGGESHSRRPSTYGHLAATRLQEEEGDEDGSSDATAASWRDQHGNLLGMEFAAVAPGSLSRGIRLPPLQLPNQGTSNTNIPDQHQAHSARMPLIPTRGPGLVGLESSVTPTKKRHAKLLQGSFAPVHTVM